MELPFSFIMDLAWNTSSIDFGTIPDFLLAFSEREFGVGNAKEISSILLEHSHLVGRRKLESIDPGTYSILNYHESEVVMSEWKRLADRVANVAANLQQDLQAAFFHLVRYPIQAGYLHHAMILGQGLNRQYGYERRNTANKIAQQVMTDFDDDFDLLQEYNSLSDGNGLESWISQSWIWHFPATGKLHQGTSLPIFRSSSCARTWITLGETLASMPRAR